MHNFLKPRQNMTSRTFGHKILRISGEERMLSGDLHQALSSSSKLAYCIAQILGDGFGCVLHDSQKVKFLCFVYLCGLKALKHLGFNTTGCWAKHMALSPPLCNVPHATISSLLTSSTSWTTSKYQLQNVKIEDEWSPCSRSPPLASGSKFYNGVCRSEPECTLSFRLLSDR